MRSHTNSLNKTSHKISIEKVVISVRVGCEEGCEGSVLSVWGEVELSLLFYYSRIVARKRGSIANSLMIHLCGINPQLGSAQTALFPLDVMLPSLSEVYQ